MKKDGVVYVFLMMSVFCTGSSLGTFRGGFLGSLTIFFFTAVLTTAGLEDMKLKKIENQWNIILLGTAAASCVTMPGLSVVSRIAGVFCISVPFLLAALLVPGSFGGGDIKLMAAGGLFLGWKAVLASAVIGIVLAGGWAGGRLIRGSMGRKEHFSLGPFLCLGMAIGVYAGNLLTDCFLNL